MQRRITKFIVIATTTSLTLIGFASWRSITKAQSSVNEGKKRPNIVLIVADDMGYSDLGAYGSEIPTPNLDTLAKRGTMLTNFHAHPQCSTSRSSLLTGVDNHSAGLGVPEPEAAKPTQKGKPGYEGHLNDRVLSIATLLKDSDYHTYMAGKWHLGSTPGYFPSDRGFEQSFALLEGASAHFNDLGFEPRKPVAHFNSNGKAVQLPKDFYSTDFYTNKLIENINQNRGDGKPFFVYAAYTSPHAPLQAPQKYINKYLGKYDLGWDKLRQERFDRQKQLGIIPANLELPPRWSEVPAWNGLKPEEQRRQSKRMTLYAAMIDNLDYNVGRLIDHLKKIGEYDNTIFVFVSDNGPCDDEWDNNEEYQRWFKQQGIDNSYENMGNPNSFIPAGIPWTQVSATPLLGHKARLSEGGMRVPAFFSYSGLIQPGNRSNGFASLLDIVPTLLEYAGVEHPGESYKGNRIFKMNGRSLRPVLDGKVKRIYDEGDSIGFEFAGRGEGALFMGDWKLVKLNPPFGDKQWKLFNIGQDSRELNDLSKQEPERLATMLFLYKQYEQTKGIIPPPPAVKTSLPSLPTGKIQPIKSTERAVSSAVR